MNVPSTMMIENIAPSEATTLARDINGLHTFLTALPSNHPSYREFSLIIDQLQRDIAFYVSGEAQRAQISSIASMARDMESIIQDCFHNY